jgi:hypothetical protein
MGHTVKLCTLCCSVCYMLSDVQSEGLRQPTGQDTKALQGDTVTEAVGASTGIWWRWVVGV